MMFLAILNDPEFPDDRLDCGERDLDGMTWWLTGANSLDPIVVRAALAQMAVEETQQIWLYAITRVA